MGDKLEEITKMITKGGFGKQLASGTVSGLLSGAILGHVGKTVAVGVGCGIIIAQIAQHKGLLADWDKLKQQAEQKSGEMGYKHNIPAMYGKVKSFAGKNRTFTAGFMGGFLLGIGI